MARAAQAALTVRTVVFSFDADPSTPPGRALQVLTAGGRLPSVDVEARERLEDAAQRAVAETGVATSGSRRGRGHLALHLVGIEDDPGRGGRSITPTYYGVAPFGEVGGSGRWAPAGRLPKLDAGASTMLRAAVDRLRADTRAVAGATALLGEVFTGDDLLRLHVALHGGPRSSERTFRRRVQELRDAGVLRPVRDSEVPALRLRIPRFRSPAGTGGRPPELLRYAGTGGEDEQLAGLRARRSA